MYFVFTFYLFYFFVLYHLPPLKTLMVIIPLKAESNSRLTLHAIKINELTVTHGSSQLEQSDSNLEPVSAVMLKYCEVSGFQ